MMDSNDLISAAKNGDYTTVVKLLTNGYSVHLRDKDEATALYWSSCRGFPNICEALIHWKSEVNAQVKWGSTPLHASCDRNHIECVKLLIKSGAILDIQNTRGDTALHLSAYRGHKEIIKLLLHAHANLFIQNGNGKIPAQEAEGNNNTVSAQILRKRMKELSVRSQISGGDGEHAVLSCPESLGPILTQQIQASKGKTSAKFVRYNSEITDFTRQPLLITKHVADEHVDEPPLKGADRCINKQHVMGLENKHRSDHDVILKRQSVNSAVNRVRQNRPSPTESIDSECYGLPSAILNGTAPSNGQGLGAALPSQRLSGDGEDLIGKGHKSKTDTVNIVTNGKEIDLKEYTEMLQMQVLKSNEEIGEKDVQIKDLTSQLENNKRQMLQYQYLCRKFYDEKESLSTQLKQTQDTLNELKKIIEQSESRTDGCKVERSHHWFAMSPSHEHLQSYLSVSSQELDTQTLKSELKSKWCRMTFDRLRGSFNEEVWVLGRDYVVVNDKALKTVHRDFTTLTLDINKQGTIYILKVVHPHNSSFDFSMFKHCLEYRILTKVSHPSILSCFHDYIGYTDKLSKFLDIPLHTDRPPSSIFMIHEKFPYTLSSYIQRQSIFQEGYSVLNNQPFVSPRHSSISLEFTYCVLYQLLSAVSCLHRQGVVQVDINFNSVYLDNKLRPILSSFEYSKLHRQTLDTSNDTVFPPMKSDIDQDIIDLGRILKDLTSSRDLPQLNDGISVNSPAPPSAIFLIDRLTRACSCTTDSARKFMLYFGMLLFPPTVEECSTQLIKSHINSRMLKLLAFNRKSLDDSSLLTPSQSVDWLKPEIESHFLTSCTVEEFLEIYQELQSHNVVQQL